MRSTFFLGGKYISLTELFKYLISRFCVEQEQAMFDDLKQGYSKHVQRID